MYIIGIDFSITKPAACILSYSDQETFYQFLAWPRIGSVSPARINLFKEIGIQIIPREDQVNPHSEASSKMRFVIENANYLGDLIKNSLMPFLGDNTYLSYEGFSFASGGDAILQLSGYKYMLMEKLSRFASLKKTYTYAPVTLKKIADCSKIHGKGKIPMVDNFLQERIPLKDGSFLNKKILNNVEKFKIKSTSGKYIELLDDLADSYWAVQTLIQKENMGILLP